MQSSYKTFKENSSKLYFGNISSNATETMFKDYLYKNGARPSLITSIVLKKKGYAFIECVDQTAADIMMDEFQGRYFMGNFLTVEPAFGGQIPECKTPHRVIVSDCDEKTTIEDVEQLLSNSGGLVLFVQKMENRNFKVTLSEDQQIEEFLEDFKGRKLHEKDVKVELVSPEPSVQTNNDRQENSRHFYRPSVFPLRVLIPSEFIGAVIGRGGATIQGIIQHTGARVDVYRSNGSRQSEIEKVITILGSPENCSTACKQILELLAKEKSSVNHIVKDPVDICLKMLSSNDLVGRVIGKGGMCVKKIMEETQTKIHVSNQNEYTRRHLTPGLEYSDRIITIRGSIDGMSNAESLISAKMKAAFEVDSRFGFDFNTFTENKARPYSNVIPQPNHEHVDSAFFLSAGSLAQTLFHNSSMRNKSGNGSTISYGRRSQLDNMQSICPTAAAGYASGDARNQAVGSYHINTMPEKTYLYIPNMFVGAIIGNKGSTIRNMIRESGASMKIENMLNDISADVLTERRVTIFGPLEAHSKAQFLIFQKLTEDGRLQPDLKLTLEMAVPSDIVGRLIGRGGMRIKEIQITTGTSIKFLTEEGIGEETFAQMYGTYHALHSAQVKIRSVINTIRKQRKLGFGGYADIDTTGQSQREPPEELNKEDAKTLTSTQARCQESLDEKH